MTKKLSRVSLILSALVFLLCPVVAVADNCSFCNLQRPDSSCKQSGIYACMGVVCYDSNNVLTFWDDWGCGCVIYAD